MKRSSLIRSLLFFLLLCTLLPIGAHANGIPSPDVHVTFENLPAGECWATLLAEPDLSDENLEYIVWDGSPEHARYYGNPSLPHLYEHYPRKDIWQTLVDHQDPDGYLFPQAAWRVDQNPTIDDSFYWVSQFKILLYYPETDTLITSEPLKRYAYDCYYAVDLSVSPMNITRTYPYGWEMFSLLVRIVINFALEFLVALLFGFHGIQEFRFLAILNAVTQILLNAALWYVYYIDGNGLSLGFICILLETLVFLLEAMLCICFRKCWEYKKRRRIFYVFYSWVANTFSFSVCLILYCMIPVVF